MGKTTEIKKTIAIYNARNQWNIGLKTARSKEEILDLIHNVEVYCAGFDIPFNDVFLYEFELAKKYKI